ncbi:hypothetical protein [Streptomyces cavernae]|uniref:hypothetical protein n=1 Tax=Streptomyces cavernae TaxID=2259034 RepID=UPI000FEBEC90|nr:hypothetical protein [Streptomyces cavernae]
MPADFEDFPLPPAEVAVTRRVSGGSAYVTVAITLAVAPFVQAVATAMGGKLADSIDTNARDAVRRLLQRTRNQAELPPPDPQLCTQVSVALSDEDSGARVLLADDLPAEAVAQLLKMGRAGTREVRGSVMWLPEGAKEGRWYVESEGRLTWVWNPADLRWTPLQ